MEASNIEEMRERQNKALAIVDKLRRVTVVVFRQ